MGKEVKKKELILSLTKKDFRVDDMRGSGPGGQYKNVTNSAIRITHESSGAMATSCDGKSQHANKATAFKRLIETPKFKTWLQIEISRRTGALDNVEEEVNKLMNEKFIKTEVQKNGKWVEVNKEALDDKV